MRHSQRWMCGGLLLLVGSFSPLAMASGDDTQQPIHIEADRAEINEVQGVMTYTGHVVLTQGGIRVTADTVVVYAKEGNLQRLIAQGQPVHYRQLRVGEAEVRGVSQRLEYTADDQQVLLLGQAEFWQGGNRFSGNRIEYHVKTERVLANAGTSSDANEKPHRVTVTLQPQSKSAKPEEPQKAAVPEATDKQ